MKITIIRHGKVNMKWSKKYTSRTFDNACQEYDLAHIERIETPYVTDCSNIYISNFLRSFETAQALFISKEFMELEDIGEVPHKRELKEKLYKINPIVNINEKTL